MTTTDPAVLLDLPLGPNGADATTVRDYLLRLLADLWRDEADFNSKRPFGSSGWQYDVYLPMIRAGLVPGHLDEAGDPLWVNIDRADDLILAAIATLGATR